VKVISCGIGDDRQSDLGGRERGREEEKQNGVQMKRKQVVIVIIMH